MARQHFYSRVPARVSMYSKRDCFDTFAKSASLPGDLALGDLAEVYKDKLDIHDAIRVRRGEIPTVYGQAKLPDGDIVHTTIKYLPTDFTGERSAYLAHSLMLSPEERAAVFYGNNNYVFNPDMFVTDISAFNITDPNASPNPSLEDRAYIPRPLTSSHATVSKYNPEVMKGMLFAIVSALCGSGNNVCFRLPVEDRYASDEALNIINSILCVLPYEMRENLSFVTYVSRPEAYKGYKLRCVGASCEVGRDVAMFDFAANTVAGQAPGYEHNLSIAAFLYSLMENRKVRDEFHAFVASISAKYNLHITDVKTLSEIVFLFWQCSGFYVEGSILPTDDTVISFLDIYEKYREGLNAEQRQRAYRPLKRYSDLHIAIPTPIFDRLNRLYTGECVPAKAVALDVALHLIHVDAMRERLFNFIAKNYIREVDSVKAVINVNLARVFYGGFLQHKILAFFDSHFAIEPVKTRDIILDKLILSIRTPEIQRQIVVFLEKHYDRLNSTQRMRIYTTCLEMIPECDELSSLLVGFINHRIIREGDDVRKLIGTKLITILDRFLKAGDSRIAAIFVNENGFCEELATRYILGQRVGGEIFTNLLAGMPAHQRAIKLLNIRQTSTDLSDEDYMALLGIFTEMPVNIAPSTVYDMMGVDRAAESIISGDVLACFRSRIIYPALTQRIFDVFKVKLGKDGVNEVMTFAKGREEILSCAQYRALLEYVAMNKHALAGEIKETFKIVDRLPDVPALRQEIGEHLLMCGLDRANQSDTTICIYELIINYLRGASFRFDAIYSRFKSKYEDIRQDETNFIKEKLDPADRRGAADAAALILSCVSGICDASATLATTVCDNSSGLKKALSDFFSIYGVGSAIYLKKHFEDGYDGVVDIINELVEERNSSISSFDDLFDLVLRRK